MRLPVGARLGPYEIQSLIGTGGMGEVYKARDTRLDRIVAVKLLSVDLADRPDLRRRFEAEARAISALSHPHICTLFDVGEQDGHAFLVMEFLEGETLDDAVTRGSLSAADVVRYAIQIAGALDHAHRQGVVHRDLKPSNIFLVRGGSTSAAPVAKLLDFGLARRPTVEPVTPTMSTLSVATGKLTAEGTILGTFQYMAPEQLEGKEADARTDIFALGAVIFEMATGRKAFDGASQASLIASILMQHPPVISSITASDGLPRGLDHLVQRCLAKNPDDRWQTARDVHLELEWIGGSAHDAPPVMARPRRSRRELIAWSSAVVGAVLAIGTAIKTRLDREKPPPHDVTRFWIAPPAGTLIGIGANSPRLAVSPNGREIAFVAFTVGRQQIWIRSLATLAARALPGTEGAVSPFWSPDSRYVGFFAAGTGELKKIDVAGGPARVICAAAMEGVAAWGLDNTILFTMFRDGVFRVSAEGGTPARVSALDKSRREINHYWPSFLPDGKHLLYMATANDSDTSKAIPSVYVAALDGTDKQVLNRIHSRTVYAGGYLLFVEDGTLLAQPFDAATRRLSGEATRVADGVAFTRTLGSGQFSVSNTGMLAYLGSGDAYSIAWYDRRGAVTDTGWPKQTYGTLRISPNGQQVAVDVTDGRTGNADLWIYDLARNVPRRFTSEPPTERNPVWSPDGRALLFTTERGGSPNLFSKAFDGAGDVEPMVIHPGPLASEDWSPDGRAVVYTLNSRTTGTDIWLKPLDGDRKERPFLNTAFEETGPRFSPDSTWLAFVSNETGATPEVYVAPTAHPGRRRQVSIGGGTGPRWRGDGKELFYASPDLRTIMSVPIESLDSLKIGVPTRLVTLAAPTVPRNSERTVVYDVTADGARLLVSTPEGEPPSSRITVVLNWAAALR
jgi:eukaryotic-like serine/threonine-protein kinase